MSRARYVFEGDEEARAPASAEATAALPEADWEEACRLLREEIVGNEAETSTPFGRRRIIYADHTASGRSLDALERQVQERVLPLYGNVHSLTTATARQSTQFRAEARQLVKQYYNLDSSYAAIFCGAGTTAAVHRFARMLENAGWDLGVDAGTAGAGAGGTAPVVRVEDRWGSIECRLCGVRLKGEAAFRAHCATDAHRAAEVKAAAGRASEADASAELATPSSRPSIAARRIVVLADPTAHHSLTLPFREAAASAAAARSAAAACCAEATADAAAGPGTPAQPSQPAVSVVDLKFADDGKPGPCLSDLEARLAEAAAEGALAMCLLSAASNVTGGVQDVAAVTELVHRAGGLACWDLAGLGGHRRPDLAPSGRPLAHVDAAFASPHKFLGGPSTCGLLLVRKALLRNPVPAVPGGGSVFFVGPGWHSYISNTEEREEAGSPDLAACARTGLCFHLHASLPRGLIEGREAAHLRALLGALGASPRVEVLAPEACASGTGTVSFLVRYMEGGLYLHHSFVSCLLNDLFGVQSRAGCACAGPHAQHLLGIDGATAADFDRTLAEDACEIVRPGVSRVSVHFADSDEHVEIMRTAICWVAEHGWRLLPHYTFDVVTGEWSHRHDVRRSTRDWLSEWQPLRPAHAGEAPSAAAASAQAPAPRSAAELARLASAAAGVAGSGSAGVPALKCPARLLWFALPQDAAWSLRQGLAAPELDPQLEPCASVGGPALCGTQRRPRAPIFAPRRAEAHLALPQPSPQLPAAPAAAVVEAPAPSRARSAKQKKGRQGPPKALLRQVHEALADFDMIVEGDRVLVGLSGGKDSLTMLHCLLEVRRTAPVKFTIAAATVDPQAAGYDPAALREYVASLGIEYHMLQQPVMERAKSHMDPKSASICSWCSRMKRGALYKCMRENSYNVLALGQHLDDIAESFMMSAFFNGTLRTMKAHYWAEGSGVQVRVIRPLVYVRESSTAEFAREAELPIIPENCPACFTAPKERHNTKLLLSSLEFEHKDLFGRLLSTVTPLLDLTTSENPFEGGLSRRRGGQGQQQRSLEGGGRSSGAATQPASSVAAAAAVAPRALVVASAASAHDGSRWTASGSRDLGLIALGVAFGTALSAAVLRVRDSTLR